MFNGSVMLNLENGFSKRDQILFRSRDQMSFRSKTKKKLGMTPPYKLGLKAHVISSLSFSKKILKMKSENMT